MDQRELVEIQDAIQNTTGESVTSPKNDEDLLTCHSDLCGHVQFMSSLPGCSILLSYCPDCNKAISRELQGKTATSPSLPSTTLSSHQEDVSKQVPKMHGGKDSVGGVEKFSGPGQPPGDRQSSEESDSSDSEVDDNADQQDPLYIQRKQCRNVKAVFRTLVGKGMANKTVTCLIAGEERVYQLYEELHVTNARRHLFLQKDVEREDLYWYDEFAALLTRSKFYITMCAMTNGDVILDIFTTRCNRPRIDIMVSCAATGEVKIVKEADYARNNPNVFPDVQHPVDLSEMLSEKTKYLIKYKWRYDESRGLHRNCKNPQRSDGMLREMRARIQTMRYSPKKASQSSRSDNSKRKPTRTILRKTIKKARTAATLNEELDEEDEEDAEEVAPPSEEEVSEAEEVAPARPKKAPKEPPPKRIQPSRKKAPQPKSVQPVSTSQVEVDSTDSDSPHSKTAYIASLEKENEALHRSLDQQNALASRFASSDALSTTRACGNLILQHDEFPLEDIEQLVESQVELARQSDLAAYYKRKYLLTKAIMARMKKK